MSFCTNCGTRFEKGERFCSHCGTKRGPERDTERGTERGTELTGAASAARRHRWRSPLVWGCVALLVAIAVVGFLLFYETGAQMPAYLKSTNDSSIRIDIEELTKGRAQLGENALNLKMAFGSETVRLNYVALSYEDGLGQELHEPPVYITPHLTPGDGVAGIYLVGWIDEKEQKLHLEWIVETEWRDIVDDQLYLHASIMDPEKGLQVQSEPICLEESSAPVLVHRFSFELQASAENYAISRGIYALATNADAEFEVVLAAMHRLNFDHVGPDAVIVLAVGVPE